MAKFRDSRNVSIDEAVSMPESIQTALVAGAHDQLIGDLLRQANRLAAEQVEAVLRHQAENRLRFGEAAIALGFVTETDVLFALSRQFHYHYAPDAARQFSRDLVAANHPFSQQAESIRAIRSQILARVFNGDGPRRALAIVSPEAGEGKTFMSANLAVSLSQLGGRTLLVDADMRGPRQQTLFGIENSIGLSGLLAGRAEGNVIQQVHGLPSLYVLPGGSVPPNPLELFERPAFGLLMRELSSKFEYVIVDTPAAIYGADAAVIAVKCGAALLVGRKNRSRLTALRDLVTYLSENSTKLAGIVMNEY